MSPSLTFSAEAAARRSREGRTNILGLEISWTGEIEYRKLDNFMSLVSLGSVTLLHLFPIKKILLAKALSCSLSCVIFL